VILKNNVCVRNLVSFCKYIYTVFNLKVDR